MRIKPGVAEVPLQEDRHQRTDVSPAADRRAGLERRRQLVDRRRRRPPAPSRTRSTGRVRSGDRPAADQEQVDDQQRRRTSSQLDQPSVVNIAWASAAPTGPHGLVGRRVGRLGAAARRIGRVVAGQAQAQEHDRQAEPDQRCGSQGTLPQ